MTTTSIDDRVKEFEKAMAEDYLYEAASIAENLGRPDLGKRVFEAIMKSDDLASAPLAYTAMGCPSDLAAGLVNDLRKKGYFNEGASVARASGDKELLYHHIRSTARLGIQQGKLKAAAYWLEQIPHHKPSAERLKLMGYAKEIGPNLVGPLASAERLLQQHPEGPQREHYQAMVDSLRSLMGDYVAHRFGALNSVERLGLRVSQGYAPKPALERHAEMYEAGKTN